MATVRRLPLAPTDPADRDDYDGDNEALDNLIRLRDLLEEYEPIAAADAAAPEETGPRDWTRMLSSIPRTRSAPPPPPAASHVRRVPKGRRQRDPRHAAQTISVRRSSKTVVEIGSALFPEQPGVDYHRPATRGECASAARPCPFVSCRHHLAIDVNVRTGSLKLNHPRIDIDEMAESCSLDVAERRDGETLDVVGALMNITRERARQLEAMGLRKLRAVLGTDVIAELMAAAEERE